jgi:hypothetical protein
MTCAEMRVRRNQALACFILALGISSVIFLSILGGQDKLALDEVGKAIVLHEALLRDAEANLSQNQNALAAVKAALAKQNFRKNMRP